MKWCRMSVDHNVKPLQSTTLHQSWDPSLTRLIHTGQTRLLGYMDDQGEGGRGLFLVPILVKFGTPLVPES